MSEALSVSSLIGIVGAGAMGTGIAQVAALAGHKVALYDIDPAAAEKGRKQIVHDVSNLIERGKLAPGAEARVKDGVFTVTRLDAFRHASLVIEAAAEQLDLKRQIFGELEGWVSRDCILATNTSSISVTAIAAILEAPERAVGMHFFNPATRMALVEVVTGLVTAPGIAQTVYDTAVAWGKIPVRARSTPGFIVNRVARPFYAEAFRLLNEQAAEPASIDALLRDSGFPMGPFELMDLIGHDVNFAVTESVFCAYFGDPRFTPSLIQRELVDAGRFGRKSGRGFYDYVSKEPVPCAQTEPAADRPITIRLSRQPGPVGRLQQLLRDAGSPVDDVTSVARSPQVVAEIDNALLLLTDGRTATECARTLGTDNVVMVDVALDFSKTRTIAVARALRCSDVAYRAVVGALQNCGMSVVAIRDVAGMVVMRTVAMLVNEAADAVNQGVCSAADLDRAMTNGVNYPVGPIGMSDVVGVPLVFRVLRNLASHYGEDRYRVSPLLAAHFWSGTSFNGHGSNCDAGSVAE